MSAVRAEVIEAIKKVPKERLQDILALARALARKPEELSTEDLKEMQAGREDIRLGHFEEWPKCRRTDI